MKRKRRGFSLVEVLLTMMILAALSGSAVLISTGAREAEKEHNRIASLVDASSIATAASLFSRIEGRAPGDILELFKEGYLTGVNASPWGSEYRLETSDGAFFVLWVDDSGQTVRVGG